MGNITHLHVLPIFPSKFVLPYICRHISPSASSIGHTSPEAGPYFGKAHGLKALPSLSTRKLFKKFPMTPTEYHRKKTKAKPGTSK
jgi:hypothetical protein